MSELLTLAFAEASGDPSGYAVAAYDTDSEYWVCFRGLPMKKPASCNPVWDIFSITEADYIEDESINRRGLVRLAPNSRPRIVSQVIKQSDRLHWLETVEDFGVRNIYYGTELLGLVGVPVLTKICFRPDDKKRGQSGCTLERPFYWKAELGFEDCDGERWDLACTDMLWKNYLWERIHQQDQNAEKICDRLLAILNDTQMFFVVEIYPPYPSKKRRRLPGIFGDRSGHYAVVGGIRSVPDWHRSTHSAHQLLA